MKSSKFAAWLIALAVLAHGICIKGVYAQSNGVPDEKTLEDELLKQKPAPPPPRVPSAPKAAKPILLVLETDAACLLEVNGDPVASLEAGVTRKLPVSPGDQLVKCSSTEEPGEAFSAVATVKPGEQKVVQIELAARVQSIRQKRDSDAQRLAAEDAAWSKASASGATAADLQGYLDAYPSGRYADPARASLADLKHRAAEDADWSSVSMSTRLAVLQTYLDEHPSGRYLDAARQRIEFIKQLPPRPTLPFALDETVWEAVENSTFYAALPRRDRKLTIQKALKVRNQPPAGSPTTWNLLGLRTVEPLNDRCVLLHNETRRTEPKDATPQMNDEYRCGALMLESVADGKLVRTASLEEVQAFLSDEQALREHPTCELQSTVPASTFNSALTGAATRYGCAKGEVFLTDLGVWLYELGEFNPESQEFIVPTPGLRYGVAMDGVPGGRTTIAYDRYSWAAGN